MNKPIKVTLTEKTMVLLKQEAAFRGITPAALAKIRLNEIFLSKTEIEMKEKGYIVQLENWREVEAYARMKNKTVEQITVEAVMTLMRRNALTPAQKAEAEKFIRN